MKVGVLGSGDVGRALGTGFLEHGCEVMLGSRNPKKKEVQDWVSQNAEAQAGTFEEVARFGEMIVLAVAGRIVDTVIELARPENFAGKTVMDTTNPLADQPPLNGVLIETIGPNESLGEIIQAKIPAARVVKAFNTVGHALMVHPRFSEGTPTMFFCGNSDEAKAQVSEIIRQFGWLPYDCGTITSARALEPLCMLWCLPGFLRKEWRHAFKLLTN